MRRSRPVNKALLSRWLLLYLVTGLAFAQAPDEEPIPAGQRGIQTAPAEAADQSPESNDELPMDRTPVLPQGVRPGAPGGLVAVDQIIAQEILIDDRSLISAEQASAVIGPYLRRPISIDELDRLRQELSLLYFDKGFVNSGVVLPDQDISQGSIHFAEVQGRLTRIDLTGNQALRDRFWTNRLKKFQPGPLQINELQATLQVIEQHALVQRVEARLLPGAAPGQSALELDVVESSPWSFNIGIDNYRSPSLGGEQATLYAAHRSLTGRGDTAEVYANLADGLGDGGFAYTLPLGSRDTKFRAYASAGDAEIVEEPFDLIDINTQVSTWGLELSHPFMQMPTQSISAFLGLEAQQSESTLLDIPFSFSLGELEGRATAVASIFGLEWIRRGPSQVLAIRISMRQGLDRFGAETSPYSPPGLNGPDNEFSSWGGQIQFVQELEWLNSELHLRGGFQFAQDPLLPVEKMPIGGAHTVRGYRENLLVRDNGATASLEWRVPLFTGDRPERTFDARNLVVAGFADFGQAWDQHTGLPSDQKQRIYSVGAGLLWQPIARFGASVYYGKGLKDLDFSAKDLQDRGWHFRLSYQL